MKTINNLKSLNTSLVNLYEGNKQININLSDKPYTLHVVLKGRPSYNTTTNEFEPTIDCMISSFGANLFARTNKGMKYEKYKNLSTLQTSLTKLVNNTVDTNGDITFSISDEVFSF